VQDFTRIDLSRGRQALVTAAPADVSFPVPDTPELADLAARAASRAGALWAAHRGLR
jgi:hypothetical protein